jgi:subtilase family serine protease
MATSSPTLTVASSSLTFPDSKNVQQALDEMASQGTSFLQASGDSGDVGDPEDNRRLDNQTLVGGTFLSTNPLMPPPPPYPTFYFMSESAWNRNPTSQNAGGGGVMDGNVKTGKACYFCGPAPIPPFQIATQQQSAAVNGGSTTARNYPDVALAADNIEIFNGGFAGVGAGTSFAAPLWAGFIALAGDLQNSQGNGRFLGPLNPTLYDIGQTSGTADDLYAATFHDIKDGSNNANGFGPGFSTVAGYDLVTGWGTPTCNLLTQLGSPVPLTDATPLVGLEFIIATGADDLRNHSQLTADILLPDGVTHLTAILHPDNSGDWQNNDADNGGHPRTIGGFKVDKSVKMQITRQNPIKSVTLTLTQVSCTGCTSENWDLTSLTVNAFSGNSQRVCQITLTGNSMLDDGSTGLFRFKENFDPDCKNGRCGPNHTFVGGCP